MQRLVRAATRVSYVVVLLDTSIVNVALDRLQAALGGYIARPRWVMNDYAPAFASLLLTDGTSGIRSDRSNVTVCRRRPV
jgi:DHA2 family methylenomycin A resistance protein-like MFS transporter